MTGDCGSAYPVSGGFYSYDPSIGGNASLLAAFVLLALTAVYLGIRFQTYVYSSTLTIGLVLEVLGFAGRILLHSARGNRGYFFLSLLGTVLGPAVISIAIFTGLPPVLGIYGEHFCPVRPVVVSLLFAILGTAALLVQLIGICFIAFNSERVSQGTSIAATGVSVQALSLVATSVLCFWLVLGFRAGQAHVDTRPSQVHQSARFKRFLIVEIATYLLVVYSIYRAAELAGGVLGVLFQNQVASMIMGGALPCIAGILLIMFHPGSAFVGAAWTPTSPRRINYHSQPDPGTPRSPVQSSLSMQSPSSTTQTHELPQSPKGYPMHHRYDPDIRKQLSQTSPKDRRNSARSSIGPPGAVSLGLPSNPKPLVRTSSTQGPRQLDDLDAVPETVTDPDVPLKARRARQLRPTPLDLSKRDKEANGSLPEQRATVSEQLVKSEELW